MSPIALLPAQITSEHITQLIVLIGGFLTLLTLITNAVVIPLVAHLISNQRRNKADTDAKIASVSQKVDDNTDLSNRAFTAANGHNEKIVNAVKVAEEAKQVVEDVKKAAEEMKASTTK